MSDITGLLKAGSNGDAQALDHLMPLVYDELRRLARRHMRRDGPGRTLQTTALVHEAYLRLASGEGVHWQDRAHFFAVAAQVMRRILVDAARARGAAKRHLGEFRVTFSDEVAVAAGQEANVLALNDALSALAKLDERKARVVELRFYCGLSVDETAEVLKISPQSVLRDWSLARAWLAREMRKDERHAS